MASISQQIVENSNFSKVNQQTVEKKSSTSVSGDEFLYLMTEQLKFQDPMNPMDNNDMLAQEAQFQSLSQMEALTDTFSKFSNMYQANTLLGQTIGVQVDGKEVIGKVEFADYSDSSGASVSVNGKMYPLSSVTRIYPENTTPTDDKVTQEDKNFFKSAVDKISENVNLMAGIATKYGANPSNIKSTIEKAI